MLRRGSRNFSKSRGAKGARVLGARASRPQGSSSCSSCGQDVRVPRKKRHDFLRSYMKTREPGEKNSLFLLVDSPVGRLRLRATEHGLEALEWVKAGDLPAAPVKTPRGVLREGAAWLEAYFRNHFPPSSLPPLSLAGTGFQKAVWVWLATLPPGRLTTYGEIARALGSPGACRAVGQAVAQNPLPIFIPCHRVLASGGKLGGYSSGLSRKRWLLAHEGIRPGPGGRFPLSRLEAWAAVRDGGSTPRG